MFRSIALLTSLLCFSFFKSQIFNNSTTTNVTSSASLTISLVDSIPEFFTTNSKVFDINSLFKLSLKKDFNFLVEIDSCGFEVSYSFYNQTGNEYLLLGSNELSNLQGIRFINLKGKFLLLFTSISDSTPLS